MDSVFSRCSGKMHSFFRESTVEKLWFLCLFLLIFPVYLGHFPLPRWGRLLVYGSSALAYCILLLKLFLWDGHQQKALWLLLLGTAILVLGTAVTGNRCFLSSFLLAASAKGISFRKISRFFFCFFLGALALNLLLVALGVLEDTVTVRAEVWGNGNLRHSFGFGHPNTAAFWGMLLIFSGLLACPRGKRLPTIGICLILSLNLFRLTDSKAAFFAVLVAMFLLGCSMVLERPLQKASWMAPVLPAVMLLLALDFLGLCLGYREDSGFFRLCNTLFSQRLAYGHQGFELFGFSLLGATVDFRWDPVDSLLCYAPICLGVLPSLVYLGASLWALYRSAKAGRWDICSLSLAGLLYCTMEYGLMNPVNLPLFALQAALSDEEPGKLSV